MANVRFGTLFALICALAVAFCSDLGNSLPMNNGAIQMANYLTKGEAQ
jgi:hypothetical protein